MTSAEESGCTGKVECGYRETAVRDRGRVTNVVREKARYSKRSFARGRGGSRTRAEAGRQAGEERYGE